MNPSYNHLDDVPWQIRDRLRGTGSADQQQDEQMSTPVNRLTRTFPDHYSPITDTNSPDRHQTTTQLQQLGSAIISAGHNQQHRLNNCEEMRRKRTMSILRKISRVRCTCTG